MTSSFPESRYRQSGVGLGVSPAPNETNRLHVAARLGDVDEVKRLLTLPEFSPNAFDDMRFTPLSCAAFSGQTQCIEALIADPRVVPSLTTLDGRNPLILAAQHGHLPAVKALREVSDLAHCEDTNGQNALMAAAFHGKSDVVVYLAQWIDPKLSTENGETAFHFAAESGDVNTIKFLMPLSDIQAKCSNNENALMRAALFGKVAAVRELVSHFDVQAKNNNGRDAQALAKDWLNSGACENPRGLRETIKFLSAYKLAMTEMAAISKNTKPTKGKAQGKSTAKSL